MKTNENHGHVEEWMLSAYALGELTDAERAAVEAWTARDARARQAVEEARGLGEQLVRELAPAPASGLLPEQRAAIERALPPAAAAEEAPAARWRPWVGLAAAAGLTALVYGASFWVWEPRERRDEPRIAYGHDFDPTRMRGFVQDFDAQVAQGAVSLDTVTLYADQPAPDPAMLGEVLQTTPSAGYRFNTFSIDGGEAGAKPAAAGRVNGLIGQGPVNMRVWQYADAGQTLEFPETSTSPFVFDGRSPAPELTTAAVESLEVAEEVIAAGEPGAHDTENYAAIVENAFRATTAEPLSTFSIDVDTASYSNVRRFLNQGALPPADAVRIEELVNYFPYRYAPPSDGRPFATHVEVASAPWAPSHRLVRIGLKGLDVDRTDRKPSNLVFLIDVSGSMNEPNKLPLVQRSLGLLLDELDGRDRVAIVVYAGAAGLVLPSTSGNLKVAIHQAIENLDAGGSTAGGAGIELAYKTAAESFLAGGVNRVILATDGDFNVGVSSEGELVRLIEEKAKSGVFLTVLGFGMGNLQDAKLEQLADKGNGHYAYVDSLREARKVLVEEMGSTLETIAKDVKIQVEFNPLQVAAWRLVGYENRLLAHQDFNDDTKDAGEIGAGHTVTALYEVVPFGVPIDLPGVDPLRYQSAPVPTGAAHGGDLLTLRLRYKAPDGDTSRLIETAVADRGVTFHDASEDFRFAASVAGLGLVLRGSAHRGSADLDQVRAWAANAVGDDAGGYRAELVGLVERAIELSRSESGLLIAPQDGGDHR